MQNDVLLSMDRQEVTLLVLIDLTAAFDAIERGILLETLEKDFGIIRDARKLLASYLSHRKQRILIKNDISDAFNLGSGLPTRKLSGTGPILNIRCWLFKIIDRHLPNVHSCADDTQIDLSFRPHSPASQDAALRNIENCVADVRAWMLSNRLLISHTKTEFVIIGSRLQVSKIHMDKITVGASTVKPVKMVRNLGEWFDSHIAMNSDTGKV